MRIRHCPTPKFNKPIKSISLIVRLAVPIFVLVLLEPQNLNAVIFQSQQEGVQVLQLSPEEETIKDNLDEIEQRLKNKEAEEARLKEEALAKENEIKALRYQLIQTANSIQDSEREIITIETDLSRLSFEEADAAAKLAKEQGNLSDILAALQSFEMSKPPALLVSPQDANRAARSAELLSQAAPALAQKADELRAIIESLTAARAGLDVQRVAYEESAKSLLARRQVLSDLLVRKEKERDVAEGLAAAAQRETASLASQATSLKGVVSRLQKLAYSVTPRLKPENTFIKPAIDIIGDIAANNILDNDSLSSETSSIGDILPDNDDLDLTLPSANSTIIASTNPNATPIAGARGSLTPDSPVEFSPARSFAQAEGALRLPVVGRIVGQFGQKSADGAKLDGLRIEVREKAIVTAPYEAKVAFAQKWGPIGNMIVLDVGEGYHILLMGVGDFLVEAGQTVRAGEPLAEMGGRETASNLLTSNQEGEQSQTLDLQIRKNGEPVNPKKWLLAQTQKEAAF